MQVKFDYYGLKFKFGVGEQSFILNNMPIDSVVRGYGYDELIFTIDIFSIRNKFKWISGNDKVNITMTPLATEGYCRRNRSIHATFRALYNAKLAGNNGEFSVKTASIINQESLRTK